MEPDNEARKGRLKHQLRLMMINLNFPFAYQFFIFTSIKIQLTD